MDVGWSCDMFTGHGWEQFSIAIEICVRFSYRYVVQGPEC